MQCLHYCASIWGDTVTVSDCMQTVFYNYLEQRYVHADAATVVAGDVILGTDRLILYVHMLPKCFLASWVPELIFLKCSIND